MIIKDFNLKEINLKYFVGISQFKMNMGKFTDNYKITDETEALNQFFSIIDEIQNDYDESVIQFINHKYLLNQDHLFTACYYFLKAFQLNINISQKKNIELLLYLATNRQISKSIQAFGVNFSQLNHGNLILCIVSPINNIKHISAKLFRSLNAEETELTINNQSFNKFSLIKEFYNINDNQLNSVLRSYGIDVKKSGQYSSHLVSALFDLICERMALLNVEKQ